jgi:hypothetical protein
MDEVFINRIISYPKAYIRKLILVLLGTNTYDDVRRSVFLQETHILYYHNNDVIKRSSKEDQITIKSWI